MSKMEAVDYWLDRSSELQNMESKTAESLRMLRLAVRMMRKNALEQAAQTAESPAQSASSSSQAIGQRVETSDTLTISSPWSSRVRANGTLELLVPRATWALCSSIQIHGDEQGEEIGLTPIFREEIPLHGSPLPSTEEPSPSASGAPGTDAAGIPSQAGRELDGVWCVEECCKLGAIQGWRVYSGDRIVPGLLHMPDKEIVDHIVALHNGGLQ